MEYINKLNYEVWYRYLDGKTTRRMAAFHFRFEAEKYIELFPGNHNEQYYIVEVED